MPTLRILVFGASGMLGSTLLRYLYLQKDVEIFGTARTPCSVWSLPEAVRSRIKFSVDIGNSDYLIKVLADVRPDVVVNCVGVVKQISEGNDPLRIIPINALFPHRLAELSQVLGARLIHFSSDCVFSGSEGLYKESDSPDPTDLYGRSKLIGEVDYPNAITLRTSVIGHELNGHRSLIGWFLSQIGNVKGFRRAIFSGLPAVEIARVVHQFVLPNPLLRGLYHVSVNPINKFDLLTLVSKVYGKSIEIIPDDALVIDRSLDSSRFRAATGFSPKPWPELVRVMRDFG